MIRLLLCSSWLWKNSRSTDTVVSQPDVSNMIPDKNTYANVLDFPKNILVQCCSTKCSINCSILIFFFFFTKSQRHKSTYSVRWLKPTVRRVKARARRRTWVNSTPMASSKLVSFCRTGDDSINCLSVNGSCTLTYSRTWSVCFYALNKQLLYYYIEAYSQLQ